MIANNDETEGNFIRLNMIVQEDVDPLLYGLLIGVKSNKARAARLRTLANFGIKAEGSIKSGGDLRDGLMEILAERLGQTQGDARAEGVPVSAPQMAQPKVLVDEETTVTESKKVDLSVMEELDLF